MAKKRKNRKRSKRERRRDRDTNDITRRYELISPFFYDERNRRERDILSDIEDNRRYRPETFKDYRRSDGRIAEILYKDKQSYRENKKYLTPTFVDPKKTIVCERRRERKEVLFKLMKIGKGKGSSKKRIWNETSKISCKKR